MEKHHLIKIKNWIFDPTNKTLTLQKNENQAIKQIEALESKHAALLNCLINHQGTIVSREKLVKIVWKDRFVDDRTINATISRLRKILGGEKQEFIKTHPKSGYSLHYPIVIISAEHTKKSSSKETTSFFINSKPLLLLTVLLCLITVWYLIDKSQSTVDKQPELIAEITPLTYEEGWEFEPSLSTDGNFLLYTALDEKEDIYIIKVQDLRSKQTFSIQEGYEAKSPIWGENNTIFYIVYKNSTCSIFSIKLNHDLTFSNKKYITSCGNVNYYTALAFNSTDNFLYFTYKESNEQSSFIKKINLSSNYEKRITTPLSTYRGDSYIRLNNTQDKLAFIRHNDDNSNAINILDLESGELKKVNSLSSNIYAITWESDSDVLYYIDENHRLIKYIFSTDKSDEIFRHRETITDLSSINEGQFLLSIGDIYDANILKFNPSVSSPKLEEVIFSSFKDHTADSHTAENKTKIIFVSNRSGTYQLWEKSQGILKQISHFKNKNTYIENVLISPNGESILLKKDDKYSVFHINEKSISEINIMNFKIASAIWSCDKSSKDVILVGTSNNNWRLIKYNLTTSSFDFLSEGITSIKANCKFKHYAFSRQNHKGFFISPEPLNTENNDQYFNQYSFHEYNSWALADGEVYLLSTEGDIVIKLNYLHQTEDKLPVTGANIHSVHFKDNTVFFNNLKPRNNFIGNVVLSNNKNTINPQ